MHAVGHVEIRVGIEVHEPDTLPGGDVSGDGANADRAITAHDKGDLVVAGRVFHPAGSVLRDLDDLGGVLRPAILAIRSPAPHLAVAVIVNLGACRRQTVDQAGLAQGLRRLLLARSERAGAGRYADHAYRPRWHRLEGLHASSMPMRESAQSATARCSG